MGPDRSSWRERFLDAGAFRFTGAACREFVFRGAGFFFDDDLLDDLRAVLLAAAFVADFFADFFAAFLPDCFLLADFRADAFFVTFLRDAFLAVDFLAAVFFGFRAVDLADRRAAVFRDDFLRTADFFFVDAALALVCLLTLRFLPVAFLPAADLLDADFFLPAPADFRFLLAAFLAGIFDSCRSEKNAELYIACPNMEAQFQPFPGFPGGPPPPKCSASRTSKAFMNEWDLIRDERQVSRPDRP